MPIASDSDTEPVPEFATWRKGVAGVLAKARRVDASELPDEPEKLLAVTTYDGLTVNPLYTRRDELPEQPLPGQFPYVRGGDATRDVHRGWFVSQRFGGADIQHRGGSDAEAVNEDILFALDNGVSAVWLGVAERGVPVEGLGAALKGFLYELAP